MLVPAVCHSQTVLQRRHPNHFIVLIDRSGSTVDNAVKKKNYADAIYQVLPELFFQKGFGSDVPAYDPANDAITVARFGIIEGDIVANPLLVRQRLPTADFLTEYIHLVGAPATSLTQEGLQNTLATPGPHYRFTLLSWCKELALWSIRQFAAGRTFNRTFLIVVDDGVNNGVTVQEEITQARKLSNGNPKWTKAEETVNNVARSYTIQPVGSALPAIGTGENQIFIVGYEVIPQSLITLEEEAKQLRPFASLKPKWGVGRSSQMQLRGDFGPDFVHWLKANRPSSVEVALFQDSAHISASEQGFNMTAGLTRSCQPEPATVRLKVVMEHQDAVLGKQLLDMNYAQPLSLPPPPECTMVWAAEMGFEGLFALCILSTCILFFYFRYMAGPMTVRFPGHCAWMLRRKGSMHLVDALPPRYGSPAFELKLLPLWLRKIFCRGAKLQIATSTAVAGDGPAAQWGNKSYCLELDHFLEDKALGYWIRNLGKQSEVKVFFEHGKQRIDLTFSHSGETNWMSEHGTNNWTPGSQGNQGGGPARKLNVEGKDRLQSGSPIYYVALDLGSESMAAYYSVVNSESKRGSLPLQVYGKRLVRDGLPWLLMENGQPSKWLRTRFDMREGRDPALQESLNFICGGTPDITKSEMSIFQFFHKELQPVLNPIPNPKIIFERGAKAAIPNLGKEGEVPAPEQLIHWLTSQVVINFVLQAPELKDVPHDSIVLILTVPNVYSVTHVESLRSFVQAQTKVREVCTVFESDAVAAYAIGSRGNSAFHEQLRQAKSKGTVELVTFDMGRGTTDLSIVQIEGGSQENREGAEDEEKRWQHYQKARTGRSDGGNKLTYLFVEYFEKTIEAAYAQAKVDRPYSFVQLRGRLLTEELRWALEGMERYIQQVKTQMSSRYSLKKNYGAVEAARDELVKDILSGFRRVEEKSENAKGGPETAVNQALEESLRCALTLPRKLRMGLFARRFGHLLRRKNPFKRVKREAHLKLMQELDFYTDLNVTALIHDLKVMADEYEQQTNQTPATQPSASRGLEWKSIPRFAVIAGQASHFEPVKKAVQEALNELGINADATYFVAGSQAKECCCQGAVAFYANYIDAVNDDHLHGTFAIIDEMQSLDPISIPVQELQKKQWTQKLPRKSSYELCFSPKPYSRARNPESEENWAVLYRFQDDKVCVEYDPKNRCLYINNHLVKLLPYGIRNKEEFYARLWPEGLLPADGSTTSD